MGSPLSITRVVKSRKAKGKLKVKRDQVLSVGEISVEMLRANPLRALWNSPAARAIGTQRVSIRQQFN